MSAATASAGLLGARPPASGSEVTEIRAIKERFTLSFLRAAQAGVPEPAETLATTLRRDGSWADLDVDAPPVAGQTYFRPFPHVHRLRKIAAVWRTEERPAQRAALAGALARGLDWWLTRAPVAKASWYQEIGVPTQLAQAVLFAEPLLSDEQRAAVVRLMRTSLQPDGSLVYSGKPATGQNLIWEAQLQVLAGCVTQDGATVARFARRAEEEMQLTTAEGLQHDFSFHQHRTQLYSGGYGQSFAEDCARLVTALAGTRYAFQPQTVENLVRYILEGQQWMMRGRNWDFGVIGRWVAWPEGTKTTSEWRAGFPGATGLAAASRDLAAHAGERAHELRALIARLDGSAPARSNTPRGCRVFWRSEYVVLSRPDFHFSIRMSSRRVLGTETSATGQGLLNWHLGDGATCLMRTGREYDDIAPVWNWRRLPGVTCIDVPTEPLPRNVWGKGAEGGSDFAGGVSDGNVGIAAMELARGGAQARKAWFLTERGIVVLGCGIRAERQGVPLVTGVEQCWAVGTVQTSEGEVSGAQAERSIRGVGWVTHAGVAYLFGPNSEVRVRVQDRQSGWEVVNTFIHAPEKVSGRVLEIACEHSGNEIGAYHYTIVPGLGPTDIDLFRRRDEPRVLANSEEVQAVGGRDRWWLVFWQAGEFLLNSTSRLRTDQPGLIVLRRDGEAWHVAVGNPTHASGPMTVSLEHAGAGRQARFTWEAGPRLGEPQTSVLERA